MPESPTTEFVSLFEKAPLAIMLCDGEGQVISINPACEGILEMRREVASSRLRLADFIHAQERLHAERLMNSLSGAEQESFQLDTKTARDERPVRWTAWKIDGANGHPASVLAIAETLVPEAAGQERLRQAQRLEILGRLASGVAHDVNNLLTGVLLYCDLLMTSLEAGHRARKYAEEIRNAGFQATGVVRQMLAFSRPGTSSPRLLSLNEIVDGMKDLLTRLIGESIELRFHLDPNLGLVRMDTTQVQQVLLNLVLNARDALPRGGQVRVETGNRKVQILPDAGNGNYPIPTLSCALFVVSDNGQGMDDDTRSHLFEPFFTTKGGKGTGLGLTTVHDIVTSNGELIYVDSAPMKGTRVSVLLPLAVQESSDSYNTQANPSTVVRNNFHFKQRNNAMTSAALSPVTATTILPQIEPANFLNLLIVDDERSIREACREIAQSLGYSAHIADSAEQAFRALELQAFDLVLLDLRLPGAGGLDALRRIKERRPDALVIVVTGYGTVQSAVQAMKNGAYDYVTKPFSVDELKLLLVRVANHLKLKSENRMLREKVKSKQGFGGIVGRAPEMEKLYRIIAKAANSVHPVLILGESGTGKEMVARSIHYSGPFRDKPFIPIDCGSLVPTLIESELFGYVKGAFTGANQSKDGLMAMAEAGTIFLDEVGELPVDLQAKMLRVIQEKEIRPVGSTKRVPINVRILAATNRDLVQAVTLGNFRRDLYFRLNVLSLRIPPLR